MHENRNNNMESFYEENAQYVATTTAQSQPRNNLKRPSTLDLDLVKKQQRFNQSVLGPVLDPSLNTPDLKMCMNTPDLEKFITDTLQTPIPSLDINTNAIKVRQKDLRSFLHFQQI